MDLTGPNEGLEPAAARFAKVREALKEMTASRLGFAQFFDAYLTDVATAPPSGVRLPKTFLHAVFIGRHELAGSEEPFDAAAPIDAAALALIALGSSAAMWDAAMAGVAAGLFDPARGTSIDRTERRAGAARQIGKAFGTEVLDRGRTAAAESTAAVVEGDAPKVGSPAQLQFARLEVFTVLDETLPDPDRLVAALLLARKRLCRIETVALYDGEDVPVTGTGFLIGPSAVLTNWHVVKDVPSPRGDTPLRVIFDYGQTTGVPTAAVSVVNARDDWLIASSEPGPLQPNPAPADWWLDRATRRAWRESHAAHLDFAVIHVEGAPGLQRGFYDLTAIDALFDGTCFALHHPSVHGRTLTSGHFRLRDPNTGYRVFHTASTAQGSSGGLVLDTKGRPAAIHYLGLGGDAPNPAAARASADRQINVAIPLEVIAATLAPQLDMVGRFDGLALAGGCLGKGRPVFGRQDLFGVLAALQRGEKRVLLVRPPSAGDYQKPGKSYTVEILEALFPAPHNLFIKVTADQVKHGARPMAEMILNALSTTAAAELPDAETTESAYEQVLVAKLREIFADSWPNSLIWLVIDDLDVHDLTDAGGRQLLNMLYSRIAEIPQLRIVLIGLKARLDTIPPELLAESPIREDELRDVAGLFKQWVALRGARDRPIDDAVLDMIAAALASYAGAERPLETLGRFTAEHLAEPLTKLFGK